jgi:hypothetical protein
MKCDKSLALCECPDIEERLAELAKVPSVAIAVAQNVVERQKVKMEKASGQPAKPEIN